MCKPCSKPAFQKFHHLIVGQLPRADQKTFQHSPARTDKTIFIMLHSFCRAYEKAGIFFLLSSSCKQMMKHYWVLISKKSLFEFRIH